MAKLYEVPLDFDEEKILMSRLSRTNFLGLLKGYPLVNLETPELVLKRMSFYFRKCRGDDSFMHALTVLSIAAYQEMYLNVCFPDEQTEKAEKLLCTIIKEYADNIIDIVSLATEALRNCVPAGIGILSMFTRFTDDKKLYMPIDNTAAATINKLLITLLHAPKYQYNRHIDAETAEEERNFLIERLTMLFLCNYKFTYDTKDKFYKLQKFLISFDHEEIMVKAIKLGLFNKKNITYAKNYALKENSLKVLPLLITVY